jgi:hypothetical protein
VLEAQAVTLGGAARSGTVVDALTNLFEPVAIASVGLIAARDGLHKQLCEASAEPATRPRR